MKTPLILVGGGGHCKSVIDVAEDSGYVILGVLDKPELVGTRVFGYPVIGTDEDIPKYVTNAKFVITVGQIKNSYVRQKIAEMVKREKGSFATIVARDAYVSKYASIGEGTVILHKAFVNAGASIGKNCIINTMANIEHEAQIGDFCHISTGAMVNGGVKVGNNVFIGSQSVINHCVIISNDCIVASGSVVSVDLLTKGIYAGNPLKLIR